MDSVKALYLFGSGEMIDSFGDKATEDLQDLLSPPGNRLEALKGKLRGFYSIRVNEQWRIVFRWHQRSAHDVQLTDYH